MSNSLEIIRQLQLLRDNIDRKNENKYNLQFRNNHIKRVNTDNNYINTKSNECNLCRVASYISFNMILKNDLRMINYFKKFI